MTSSVERRSAETKSSRLPHGKDSHDGVHRPSFACLLHGGGRAKHPASVLEHV